MRALCLHSLCSRSNLPLACLCATLMVGVAGVAADSQRLHIVRPAQFSGMCDASGAVALNSNLFAVACDEDNTLRVYRWDQPGGPVKQFDCNAFLEMEGKSLEADLEGAARIGDRAFWIGSHGRNKNGKERLNRCRLFATDIRMANGDVDLVPVGRPYKRLVEDLIGDGRFARYDLAAASQHAPKEPNALDIEGLAATPEGQLLIGFRNPIPKGKALLIPLLNPNEVVLGQAPRFDSAIELDLGGLGIRDIARYEKGYLIIAGSYDASGQFQLYQWAGPGSRPEPLTVKHLNRYNPEGIVLYPQKGLQEFQILSDDGTRLIEGVPGKEVADPARRVFRSFWLTR
ncbi:MAG TPA: DUF3616 domain-containing protein [Bacillota bacterium]|nr:DUF3616 domain-containing protein [Bacillota bacterium]